MSEKVKSSTMLIFKALVIIVSFGQFSSWIFDYNDKTIQILNTAMFSLIGIAYLVFAWALDKKILKLILLACGIYLIVMNYLVDSILQWTMAFICILMPMIIGKFLNEEADSEERIVN